MLLTRRARAPNTFAPLSQRALFVGRCKFVGVERLEVEVFDWLRGERVKRPLPDYETLELADPRDAMRADYVWLEGLVDPGYFLDALSSLYRVYRGDRGARRLPPVAGEELYAAWMAAFSTFTTTAVSPQYFYTLLHALGCRKLAFLFFGTKPLDEEEEWLREIAVLELPPRAQEVYRRLGSSRRSRVVLLWLFHPDILFGHTSEEELRRHPWGRGALRVLAELRLLEEAAKLVAPALERRGVWHPFPPWSDPPLFYAYRMGEVLAEAAAAAALRDAAEKAGFPFREPPARSPPSEAEAARGELLISALDRAVAERLERFGFERWAAWSGDLVLWAASILRRSECVLVGATFN
jgi:hypothetical protein